MPLAVCHSCHKRYKIPSVDKKYRCKECDCPLEVDPARAPRPRSGWSDINLKGLTCPHCKAFNPEKKSKHCVECGGDLHEASFSEKEIRTATRIAKADDLRTTREMSSAKSWISAVRSCYFIIAGLCAFIAVLIVAVIIGESPRKFDVAVDWVWTSGRRWSAVPFSL